MAFGCGSTRMEARVTGFGNERTHTIMQRGTSMGNGDSAYHLDGDGCCDAVDRTGDGKGGGEGARDGDGWGCGEEMVIAYAIGIVRFDAVPANLANVYAD